MRYCPDFVFKRFGKLVSRLCDKKDPYGSLIKLEKETESEARLILVYAKGMDVLQQRYLYYKGIISGSIKYSSGMGSEKTYQNRAYSALRACHFMACEVKNCFNQLIISEIPKRYERDLEILFCLQEKKEEVASSFNKDFYSDVVSSVHVFESMENSIVSDCEMLGFCICDKHNIPPFMYGCMEKGRDILMLDEAEERRMWQKATKITGELIGSIVAKNRASV